MVTQALGRRYCGTHRYDDALWEVLIGELAATAERGGGGSSRIIRGGEGGGGEARQWGGWGGEGRRGEGRGEEASGSRESAVPNNQAMNR